jgi:UDP-glucuronate 4-epimerase
MKTLVTGSAGFIGFHVSKRLLTLGHEVVGVDNLSDYYEPKLKCDRLAQLLSDPQFRFEKLDLADRTRTAELFRAALPVRVIHLAAQPGVRYSVTNPYAYIDSNLVAFANILEGCRHNGVKHLTYASSSSVYGGNECMPFSVRDNVDHPLSLYAATKKANELMAHTYSHLYDLPTTGLRFFTVYGPWGRPDMAIFKFTKAILDGQPIDVFNEGRMKRDFTYVDDIVEGVVRVSDRAAAGNPDWDGSAPDPGTSRGPYRLYNIGNNQPIELLHLIKVIERCLGRTAKQRLLPMQPGDLPATFADVSELTSDVGFKPSTSIEDGVRRFVQWYLGYYRLNGALQKLPRSTTPFTKQKNDNIRTQTVGFNSAPLP